jgi:preprotein translocase subunit SecB
MKNQKLITLKSFGCSYLTLVKTINPSPEDADRLGLDLFILRDEANPNLTTVRFRIDAYHSEAGMSLKADYDCLFETNFDLNPDVDPEKIFKINAAAIAFPYFRAYITQITLLSGFPPLILPTINFSSTASE